MTINLQFTCRDFPPPILAEDRIRERVERLERLYPRMISLYVVAEQVQRRHHKGTLYVFRLDASMPGKEIAVNRGHADKHAHEDFFVAMRDSFNALERSLKTFTEKQARDVKTRAARPQSAKGIIPL
ncbi:MAG: RNA polymerase subunit sigma-54 [Rhodospirillales bacterium CG15_BIG_FIL_POST_REV_8_21_14_020_66_15]|nr:MAG: RNA polymerase subunit sigma-54 [Rhodospirillales bacterium CG15_BIG_FIL_POST_REV_8_21_14_020_66_15]